jgi:hypothetical protein
VVVVESVGVESAGVEGLALSFVGGVASDGALQLGADFLESA